jgi:hypothetical protein
MTIDNNNSLKSESRAPKMLTFFLVVQVQYWFRRLKNCNDIEYHHLTLLAAHISLGFLILRELISCVLPLYDLSRSGAKKNDSSM